MTWTSELLIFDDTPIYKPVFLFSAVTTMLDPWYISRWIFGAMLVYIAISHKRKIDRRINDILLKSFFCGRITGWVLAGIIVILF